MSKADGNASCSPKKIIANAIRQFSCPELPKSIKGHAEINRALNQKKQNSIRAGCDCGFAAFYCKETATQTGQTKIRASLRLCLARLMATE